jgi:hypothetical protein
VWRAPDPPLRALERDVDAFQHGDHLENGAA